MEHKHTPDEERRIREAALDETIADTFPASDAPSTLPNPDNDDLLSEETDEPGEQAGSTPASPSWRVSSPAAVEG